MQQNTRGGGGGVGGGGREVGNGGRVEPAVLVKKRGIKEKEMV